MKIRDMERRCREVTMHDAGLKLMFGNAEARLNAAKMFSAPSPKTAPSPLTMATFRAVIHTTNPASFRERTGHVRSPTPLP
jgi:hypothetical protein